MSVMDTHVETMDELLNELEGEGKNADEVQSILEEAEQMLGQMKLDLHSVTNKQKKDDYIIKMQSYQRLIAKHRKVVLTTSTGSLNGTRPAISATEKNEASLEVLKKAHAQLAETEEVGINVLTNLAKQKETIQRTKGNLDTVNSQMTYSNKLVTRMGKWWRG